MPSSTNLVLTPFVPNSATNPGQVQVDSANTRIILATDNLPTTGGSIEITTITLYVVGSAINTSAQDVIRRGDNGYSDGIIEGLMSSDAIVSDYEATLTATNKLALTSQPNLTGTIVGSTLLSDRIRNFKPRQQFRIIDPYADPPINVLVKINTVNRKFLSSDRFVDHFTVTINFSIYIIDPDKLLAKSLEIGLLPRYPRGVQLGGL